MTETYICIVLLQVICIKKILCRNNTSLILILSLCSCERSATNTDSETVSWPEITEFDNIAFQADGLVRVKDLEAARKILDELMKAGRAVTSNSIPSNAAKPEEVGLILSDLENLV